jgi:MFS family permease
MSEREDSVDPLGAFRGLLALETDVLVLSLAMFAFSLGFQMTGRYMAEYLSALGAGAIVVGLYGTVGNVIGAVYPYPGGAVSDRIGSRNALTAFGLLSTLGFLAWLVAPALGPLAVPAVFLGLFLAQAWKSFGLGATFAVVKQSVPPARLAAGFASTETFRRTAFLLGPLIAAALFAPFGSSDDEVVLAFQAILVAAVVAAAIGTLAQHRLYDPSEDSIGAEFAGLAQIRRDLRSLPGPLRPLLVGDTLVRFANGMVYVFFVLVVTDFLSVGVAVSVPGIGAVSLSPQALFGVLLAVEMLVALLTMVPAAALAERVGLKPVVAVGFAVYATFPVLLIYAPADAATLVVLFAFSGLRFAGLPAHKALIVGPAEADEGGRVTGSYYLVRNAVVIPSGLVGGYLYAQDPEAAFLAASAIGALGVLYFLLYGEEFAAYA